MATKRVISDPKVLAAVQVMLEDSAVIAPTVRMETAEKGQNSINLPTRLPREGQKATVGAVNFTNNVNNYDDDILTLTDVAGDYFVLDIHEEMDNIFSGKLDAIEDSIKAMANVLDKELITKALLAAQETEEVRGSDFYADCVNMRKAFRKAKIPLNSVYLALTPEDEALALATNKIVSYNEKGNGSSLESGEVRKIAGFNIVTPSYDDTVFSQSFAYHSLGLVYCWHGEMTIISTPVAKTTKEEVSVSRKFGCKALQAGALIFKWKAPAPVGP